MNIICINREFSSGGREIAKRLSEALGYFYYDREIISEMVKQEHLDEEYIESILNANLSNYVIGQTFIAPYNQVMVDILVKETEVIKELATRGNCIFVGRSANVILQKYNPLTIFIYSDKEAKLKRCRIKREDEQLDDKKLWKKMKKIDKERRRHQMLLGDDTWGKKEGYDMMINTSIYEDVSQLIPTLKVFCEKYFEVNNALEENK